MDKEKMSVKKTYSIKFAVMILLVVSGILTIGVSMSVPTAALLAVILLFLITVALINKVSYACIEKAMLDGIKGVVSAIVILLIVGIIIAMWIECGTVPMIIYYGLGIVSADMLLPITFLLCAILSVCTGTSWGTCGTIGIACVSIGASLGIPIYIVAAAAISGATVGDKLSPLSDTTIIASSIAGTDVYKHIKAMMYTSIPTFIVTLIIYFIIGMSFRNQIVDYHVIDQVRSTILGEFNFSPLLLLLPVAICIMSIKKVPAILTLLISGFLGGVFAMVIQKESIVKVLNTMYSGYSSSTGVDIVDNILSKGGLMSMLSTVCIIVFALGVGGILNELGFLKAIIEKMKSCVKTDEGLVITTLFCGIMIVVTASSLYVSEVLLGGLFKESYEERGIDNSILSRTMEEATTVVTPLIPWNSSFIYYTQLFGLTGLAFIPFTVFCWLNPLVSIVLTRMGLLTPYFRDKSPDKKGKFARFKEHKSEHL